MNLKIHFKLLFLTSIIIIILSFFLFDLYLNLQLNENQHNIKSTFLIYENVTWPLFVDNKRDIEFINQKIKLVLQSACKCRQHEQIILTENEQINNITIYLRNFQNQTIVKINEFTLKDFHNFNFTCDLYKTLRHGPHQNVISFSLYGKENGYYYRLNHIAEQISKFYENKWSIRIYHDDSIYMHYVCDLECMKNNHNTSFIDIVDFCHINKISLKYSDYLHKNNSRNFKYVHAMMWRWFPIGDSFVDFFSSRDTDSLIIQREIDAVFEWNNSNKVGHIMRGKKF